MSVLQLVNSQHNHCFDEFPVIWYNSVCFRFNDPTFLLFPNEFYIFIMFVITNIKPISF